MRSFFCVVTIRDGDNGVGRGPSEGRGGSNQQRRNGAP